MKSTIVNGLPIDIMEEKPGCMEGFFIPRCPKDEDFSVTYIDDTSYQIWAGDLRGNIPFPVKSIEMATAICSDLSRSMVEISEDARPLLFAIEGELTAEQVKKLDIYKESKAKQKRWFGALVARADDEWVKFHDNRMISDIQRHACRSLGLDKEWMELSQTGLNCPVCFTPYNKGQLMCKVCRCVLDPEKIKNYQFVTDSPGPTGIAAIGKKQGAAA